MTYLSNVLLNAAFSYYILVTLIFVGTPLRPLLRRGGFVGCGDWLLGLLPGLLIVSVAAWYCTKLNIAPVYLYGLVIVLGAIYPAHFINISLFNKDAEYQAAAKENLRLFFQDSCAFLLGVVILNILLFRNLRSSDLPWVTSGNNDLFSYLKFGAYLLDFPNTTVQAGVVNLWNFSRKDLFGDFNVLAFSAFIGRTGIENTPIPVIGLAIGVAVTAITRICRKFYGLAAFEAYSIAILMETSGLLVYLIYCYFLGQLFFIALFLLALMVLLLAVKNDGGASYISLGMFMMLAANCILFMYQMWYLQFVLIFSAMVAYSFLIGTRHFTVRIVAKTLAIFVLAISSCTAVSACLLPERFFLAIKQLAELTKANIAGWPFGFVNPQLVLGMPAVWDMNNPKAPVLSTWFPIVAAIFFVILIVKRFHSNGRLTIRVFSLPLLAFFASLVLYLIVWLHYGFSYKQWKFATTLSLPLGFTLIASLIYALTANSGRDHAIPTGFVMLCLLGGISANVYDVIHHWGKPAFHFSSNLKLARQAMPVVGGELVYVNVPEYSERMAAAVFIDAKLISFSGPTYYGPGLNPAAAPQSMVTEFYRKKAGCEMQADIGDSPAVYGIRAIAWQNLAGLEGELGIGTTVQFSKDVSPCLALTGFSGIEPWGRWTDGNHATISFRCRCGDAPHLAVKLEAGTLLYPKLRDVQRAIVRVNGKELTEFRLTSGEPKPLLIPIPALPADDNVVRITIELPDAISPSANGSADTRVLGLSLHSLQLIEDHVGNDGKS